MASSERYSNDRSSWRQALTVALTPMSPSTRRKASNLASANEPASGTLASSKAASRTTSAVAIASGAPLQFNEGNAGIVMHPTRSFYLDIVLIDFAFRPPKPP